MYSVQQPACPLDYSHCDQTVTIYHQDKMSKEIHRVVIHGAHLDFKRTQNTDKTGSKDASSFFLVVPESSCRYVPPDAYTGADGTYTLAAADKVQLGEGPHLPDRAAWASHIPTLVNDLVVVQYVDPKFWRGERCHLEAGG